MLNRTVSLLYLFRSAQLFGRRRKLGCTCECSLSVLVQLFFESYRIKCSRFYAAENELNTYNVHYYFFLNTPSKAIFSLVNDETLFSSWTSKNKVYVIRLRRQCVYQSPEVLSTSAWKYKTQFMLSDKDVSRLGLEFQSFPKLQMCKSRVMEDRLEQAEEK